MEMVVGEVKLVKMEMLEVQEQVMPEILQELLLVEQVDLEQQEIQALAQIQETQEPQEMLEAQVLLQVH